MQSIWLKRSLQHDMGVWITFYLSLLLALLMGLLCYAAKAQARELLRLEREFHVWVSVSDIFGRRTDGLDIAVTHIALFTGVDPVAERANHVEEFFTDICLKRTFAVKALENEPQEAVLLGITRRESDAALSAENGAAIQFFEEYSWEDFSIADPKPVCLIPSDMTYNYESGTISVLLAEERVEYLVIGFLHGVESRIYVPWMYAVNTYQDGEQRSDSISARMADNTRLSEMKEYMRRYFTQANPLHPPTRYLYALTVFDAQYNVAHESASHKVALLVAAQRIDLILVVVIGCVSGYLLLRTRKHAYALLRSVGQTKGIALFQIALPYLLSVIAGGCLYAIAALTVPYMREGFPYTLPVVICFTFGFFTAEIAVLRESALCSLQTNE